MAPSWTDILQAVSVAGGVIGAVLTYRRDVGIKQTDWLYQLFEKFYEKPQYKVIRRILDNEQSPDFDRLREAIERLDDTQHHEEFVDFLNFFEFICNLVEDRRMKRADMNQLFDYYLKMMSKRDFVVAYTAAHGFEALHRELKRRASHHGR